MWSAVRDRAGGLLSFFLCCFVAIAPRAIVDGWRTVPLLVIWAAGAAKRWRYGDRQVVTDCVVFGIWNVILARMELKNAVFRRLEEDMTVAAGSWFIVSRLLAPFALLAYFPRWRAYCKPTEQASFEAKVLAEVREGLSPWTSQYPKARIFPCQTKHARMFPKRHAFEYSYLQCGFPIIPDGVDPDGRDTNIGSDVQLGRWWLRVKAEDYLNRGNGRFGFYNKLKLYLQEHHVEDAAWSYAYLVTAPSFFGYSFNPVSFWYIYDTEHQLTKMILEVNNTFGERRIYLLDGSNVVPITPDAVGPDLPLGTKSRFTDIWMKDFHVSPFNSRKGSYVLKASNPFPHATYDNPIIDNTITLISSKDHAKLVARLNSTGAALDQDQMSVFDTMRFILSWWWVGLVTFPRIVKEAGKLFFKRSLHVWFRPEVLHTSIGRSPTTTEIEIYKIFKDYLNYLVNTSENAWSITLHTAIPTEPITEALTWHVPGLYRGETKKLEIRVLTPAFYSRFVHYAHTSEAFDRECIFTDEKNRTLWISQPQLLPALLNKRASVTADDAIEAEAAYSMRSRLDELRWKLLKKLRCPPASPAYAVSTPSKAEFTTEDVRSLPYSACDEFVRIWRNSHRAGAYRRSVTKLFLAERFGFGFAEVLGLIDLIVRTTLCWLAASQLVAMRARFEKADIGGCSTKIFRDTNVSAACFTEVKEMLHGEWWWLVGTMIATSACHGYGLMKGYL